MWFDTKKEEMDREFSLVLPGTHRFKVVDASYGALKSGNGSAFTVAADVTEGQSKGSRLFIHFNTDHTSDKARQIGRGQFKRFLTACGVDKAFAKPQDACNILPGKTFTAEVDHELGVDNVLRAKVKRYELPVVGSHLQKPSDDVLDNIPF